MDYYTIGICGHVDHGKTTLNFLLTNIWTDKHSEEIKRGITLYTGYGDTNDEKLYSLINKTKEKLKEYTIIDVPGHEFLLPIAYGGIFVSDILLIVISLEDNLFSNQTIEHFKVIKSLNKEKDTIIIISKIDLIDENIFLERKKELEDKLKIEGFENNYKFYLNLTQPNKIEFEKFIECLINKEIINKKENNYLIYPLRSFDINKPNKEINNLKEGVIGGLINKNLEENMELRVLNLKNKFKIIKCLEIFPKDEGNIRLIKGVRLNIDPFFTQKDSFINNLFVEKNTKIESLKNIQIDKKEYNSFSISNFRKNNLKYYLYFDCKIKTLLKEFNLIKNNINFIFEEIELIKNKEYNILVIENLGNKNIIKGYFKWIF